MGKFEALTSEYIAELLQRRDRLQYEAIVKQLTEETRLAILWIKDVGYHLLSYRNQVYSVDIYDAVLAHAHQLDSMSTS